MIAIPALTFADRLASLRATKLRQTAEKRARLGPVDADDTGIVLPPEDFAWQPTPSHPNGSFYGPKAWAENFRSMLEAIPVYMDPADALAGRWRHSLWGRWPVKWHPDYSYAHLVPDQQRYGIIGGIGHPHHFAGDYTVGLQLGWDGILAKIRHWRGHGDAAGAEEFRDALETVVRAIQGWIRRTVALARHLETFETRPGLRENLAEVIAVNEWIVGNPPRTFREACQWIAWFNMASRSWNGDGAGGRLDVLLEPYFERDTAAGLLDEEEAVFILACLLLNDPHYYQLGGPAPDGHDVTSRLSFLVLDAAHRIGIPCNLTVRVHDGLDPRFLDRAVRYLLEDRKAWPRFMGDKGMTEGFVRNGYPPELARQRIAVGCHWAVIPGREYTLNDVVKINVAKVFELALAERLGSTPAAAGSEALWDGFCRHLDRAVHCTVEGIELHLAHQWETAPELVIDLLCHGPIEKGRDASGGASSSTTCALTAPG